MSFDALITYLSARPLEVINLCLALIGFMILGVQTRKARSAAEASTRATQNAVTIVSERTTLADIYALASVFRAIQDDLRGSRLDTALFRCQLARPELHKLRTRRAFSSDQRRQAIQEVITTLRKLEDAIEKTIAGITPPIDIPRTNKLLSDFVNNLYEWGEDLKYHAGSIENDPSRDL